MNKEDYLNGQVLLIDKPLEWTSFQVVNKIRWHIKKKFGLKKIKVGHAGTLDPLASGLLIICTGKETKNIATYQGQIKEYTGTFTIGATTPSYDLETAINERFATKTNQNTRARYPGRTGNAIYRPLLRQCSLCPIPSLSRNRQASGSCLCPCE